MATVRVEEGDMRELLNELNHLRRQRDELQTRGTELVMNVRHLTKVVSDLEEQLMRMKGVRNELERQKREYERLGSWPLRIDMECTNCEQGVEMTKVEEDPPTYRCPNCDIDHEFLKGWYDEFEASDETKAARKAEDAPIIKEGHYYCSACKEHIYVCQDRPANWNSNEPSWKGVPACPFCKRADHVHPTEYP